MYPLPVWCCAIDRSDTSTLLSLPIGYNVTKLSICRDAPDAITPEAWKRIYWTMVSLDICR